MQLALQFAERRREQPGPQWRGECGTLKRQYDARQVEAARVILVDIERWGGEDAAIVRWARMYLRKGETE